MNYHRVLVLAPHTDDAELGCGGTISRTIEEGVEVFIAVFSIAEDSLPRDVPSSRLKQEFFSSCEILGVKSTNQIVYEYKVRRFFDYRQDILDDLVKLRKQIGPDLILMPSCNDVHQDHQVIHMEGLRAFRDSSMLGYELPWNHITFSVQAFTVLEQRHVQRKWDGLQMYKSQLDLNRSYFSREFIEGLAKVRGVQAKADWAEAFEVLRLKW